MTEEDISIDKKETKKFNRNNLISTKNVLKYDLRKSMVRRLSRKNRTKIEISRQSNKEELENELNRMKKILRHSSLYDLCINAISYKISERTIELNKAISYYLRSLKNFMNILSNQSDEELDKILYDIASHLQYEKYEKNKIICKYGEKADKFYIILKGKVIFLVPKMKKHYLSEAEYLEYLLRLRKKGEIELVHNIITINQLIFYYGDDFDEYIINALDKFENKKENIYSNNIYKQFYEFKKFKEKEKKKSKEYINESINIDEYIKTTIIHSYDNSEIAKLAKKKLLTIYEYERTNIFEDGDSFGAVGANSKSNKRTATSISYENCHLGILTKEDYINILEKVNSKARDRLYDLVTYHKIFTRMTKYTFNTKYMHMFHFVKYYKNDNILNDSQEFNNLIILYKGEYTISINKNIIELNDLIIKVKKIRGEMMNIPEELIKKDLKEIDEKKSLIIRMRYSSKDVSDLIIKKQNYILSKVKESLLLGYPNTIDKETNLPLFNCECCSRIAFGFKVKKEMLKLIEKEGYLRKSTPEIASMHIDIFLERLLELKKMIMAKIDKQDHYTINENNFKLENNDIKENNNNINNEDNKWQIFRNSNPKNNKTKSVLFDFNRRVISTDFGKSLKLKKANTLSPINKKLQTINNIKEDNNNKISPIKNFFILISKFKKNSSEKSHLLRKVQKQSQKFLEKEKREMKKIQINLNKLKSKEEYNDFSSIFAKNPATKKTLLDKFKRVKNIDNILDPMLKDIKQKFKYNRTIDYNLIRNNSKTVFYN